MNLWWALAVTGLALALYATAWEPFAVRLRRVRVDCPRLPREFDGFTVLQISDVHMSKMGRRERALARVVRGVRPDVVALTGDLCSDDASARDLVAIAMAAGPSAASFAISGNLECRYPDIWESVGRVLREAGVRILENEHLVFERGSARIVIAGVEDPHTGADDLRGALEGAPAGMFTLLLAHSPAIIGPAVEKGIDFVITGHTHGGQVALPLVGALVTRSGHGNNLASGLFAGPHLQRVLQRDPGRTQLYVTRGIGSSLFPLRFMCPPEAVLFEFRSGG